MIAHKTATCPAHTACGAFLVTHFSTAVFQKMWSIVTRHGASNASAIGRSKCSFLPSNVPIPDMLRLFSLIMTALVKASESASSGVGAWPIRTALS